ncbi:MAG: hypothetical protein AAGB22_02915, partial [Bacteroidota bacterium]
MKKLLTSLTAVLAGSTLWAQIYTVTSTSDANTAGTLRHAINEVNAGNNTDIHFNISGTAPFTIALNSALPQIANPVNIDGTTQSGYVSSPIITVDGQDASIDGFVFLAGTSGSSIIGLEITGMGYPDATSTAYYGVKDWDRATVQDNVINNCKNGIYSDVGTKIYGNYIGLNISGSQAIPNKIGVVADAGAEIGKVGSAFRNVISGNDVMGVYAGMSTIKNNYIGVNASGSFAIPNEVGVGIYNSSVELGGHLAGEGNVISGNTGDGVRVEMGRFIIIDGNYIGTNASG